MIELHPFSQEDIPRLVNWIDSPAFLVQWTGAYFSHPFTPKQFKKHLQRASEIAPACKIYKGVKADTGQVIGHIELDRIDYREKTATVCRVLVGPKAARGHGYGTVMMEKILQIAFEELGLEKVYLHVVSFNNSAIACYKKVGFTVECILENKYEIGGKRWNTYRMSLLKGDWQLKRGIADSSGGS